MGGTSFSSLLERRSGSVGFVVGRPGGRSARPGLLLAAAPSAALRSGRWAEEVVDGEFERREGERAERLATPEDAGRAVTPGCRVEVSGDPVTIQVDDPELWNAVASVER